MNETSKKYIFAVAGLAIGYFVFKRFYTYNGSVKNGIKPNNYMAPYNPNQNFQINGLKGFR